MCGVVAVGTGELAFELGALLRLDAVGTLHVLGLKTGLFLDEIDDRLRARAGLIVEPQPAGNVASEATRITNAVRLVEVLQIRQTGEQSLYAESVRRRW